MPVPPDLPAALFLHAGSSPEEPWLFQPEGWDWRWHSWREIAREVQARAESLSASAAGSRVTFPYTAQPEAIVFDLAVQAAGLVAVPFSGPPPPHHPEEGRGGEGAGGAVVVRNGEPVELTAVELIAMANRLQELIAPSRGSEIVVLSGSIEDPDERAMLSWATLAGAAVVLEPNPALRVATAAWTRPTVFHGTAAELAVLRDWAVREKRGWLRRSPRRPFRRLRTVLVTGPEALGQEEKEFWEGRGVRVAGLSAMS